MKTRICFTLLCLLCLLDITTEVMASGLDCYTIGARGASMGRAFTAIADDSSAVFYNPGGMVFQKNDFDSQATMVVFLPTFTYEANGMTDKSDTKAAVPGLFASYKTGEWAFGLGMYVPYGGGGTKYSNFQNSGYDLEAFMAIGALTVSAAYKITERLAIGVGVTGYYTVMESTDNRSGNTLETDYSDFSGTGGNLGILYKASDKLSIGFRFSLASDLEIDGNTTTNGVKSDSTLEFTIPYSFNLGFAYQLMPELVVSVEGNFSLYSQTDEMVTTTNGSKTPVDTHYGNSYNIGLGTEYQYNQIFAFRAGIIWDSCPTHDAGVDATSNDVDTWFFTLGVGYHVIENLEFDVSYQYYLGFERNINSQKFDKDINVLTVAVRFMM